GYVVRDMNWRHGRYELDIVAYKDGLLVVVEVKTRSSDVYIRPEEAVTPAKCRRIIDAADAYVKLYDLPFEVRFDIIALIEKADGTYDIEHIEEAFFPTLH
ncbi:MAG: YraN family protein, partial [Porphyromonadaceae bacterium]|nr:YraN family protein [Porphyromonadaceae bacterium]